MSTTTEASEASVINWAHTVAHVDLGSALSDPVDDQTSGRMMMLDLALRNIEQTVRGNDRVCPYGLSRIAIAFGPDAQAVAPKLLGERLARAVGKGLMAMCPSEDHPGPVEAPGGGPRKASIHGLSRPRRARTGWIPSTTVVTVDRLLKGANLGRDPALLPTSSSVGGREKYGVPVLSPWLRHRTVVRYSTGRLAGYGTRHDDHRPPLGGERTLGTVLVVDPNPTKGEPGLAALAISSLAERLGFSSAVTSLTANDSLIPDIDCVGLDLVVLVIGRELAGERSSWSRSTWCVPAQLASAYASIGIGVLAVSAGAGAGALAGCVEQGASALFDLDGLPVELHALGRTGETHDSSPLDTNRQRVPPQIEPFLKLTSSERRVLFYLTTGRSAQDIADDLIVSLATIRSHIRSILQKLEVRSQLAAVAMANSCAVHRHQSRTAS